MDKTELIQEKRSYLGSLKSSKIKNKVRIECFSKILSLTEKDNFVESIKDYCKEEIELALKTNENIEEEMGSVFNSWEDTYLNGYIITQLTWRVGHGKNYMGTGLREVKNNV